MPAWRRALAQQVAYEGLPYFQRRLPTLGGHEARAVVTVGFQGVMRHASEAKVSRGVRATLGPRMDVSKLEPAGLVAPMAVFADKATATFVSGPNLATHGGFDAGSSTGSRGLRARGHGGLG